MFVSPWLSHTNDIRVVAVPNAINATSVHLCVLHMAECQWSRSKAIYFATHEAASKVSETSL